jgi:hypothetical protein
VPKTVKKRNDPDPIVRDGATKCNLLYVALNSWSSHNSTHQITTQDVMISMSRMQTFLSETMIQRILEHNDEALRTLVRAMTPDMRFPINVDHPDHRFGFYAVDAMYDENCQQVKLLDFNPIMGAEVFSTTQIMTDESHGLPYPEDLASMALTSFQQFSLGRIGIAWMLVPRNSPCGTGSCKEDRVNMNKCPAV